MIALEKAEAEAQVQTHLPFLTWWTPPLYLISDLLPLSTVDGGGGWSPTLPPPDQPPEVTAETSTSHKMRKERSFSKRITPQTGGL